MEKELSLREYRCTCGKLLFKGSIVHGVVEVKCKSCRKVSSFSAYPSFSTTAVAVPELAAA